MLENIYKTVLYLCVIGTIVYVFLNYFKKAGPQPAATPVPSGPRTWISAAVLVLFFFLCLLVDPSVKAGIRAMRSPELERVFRFFNMFGDGNFLYAVLFVPFIIGKIFRFRKLERLFGLALFSSLIGGFVVQVLQNLTLRARPFVSDSAFDFFNYAVVARDHLFFSVKYKSFPSGHAVTIFAAVMPFLFSLRRWWWKALLLLLPVMTGLARIYLNRHWLSDVFVSAILAAVIARWFWNLDRSGRESPAPAKRKTA